MTIGKTYNDNHLKACSMYNKQNRQHFAVIALKSCMVFHAFLTLTYSMTTYMSFDVSMTSYKRIMCGCMKSRKILISRRTAVQKHKCERLSAALADQQKVSGCVADLSLPCPCV